jgi:glycosyltransferase involved in cell wall biosynthesis
LQRDVTVVIPSIAPRRKLLGRALHSVTNQDEPVADIAIAIDSTKQGAWTTRNRGIAMSRSTWTAFLDDDDELLPHHTQFLLDRCDEYGLDLAWGWFSVVGGGDPFPMHRGKQYDVVDFHVVPITYLVRTELLHEAVAETGGFVGDTIGAWHNQDRGVFDHLARNGKHMAFPDITWLWHHHLGNTSGLPDRWPADGPKPVVFR